jgi:hypothetical protein
MQSSTAADLLDWEPYSVPFKQFSPFGLIFQVLSANKTLIFENPIGSNRLILSTLSTKLRVFDAAATLGLTAIGGSKVISLNSWHMIELAWDLAAGGVIRVWLDGNLEIDTVHTLDVSAKPTTAILLSGETTPNEYFYDDLVLSTGGLNSNGVISCIARQPKVGSTPTYDQYTKSSGTDAGALGTTPLSVRRTTARTRPTAMRKPL